MTNQTTIYSEIYSWGVLTKIEFGTRFCLALHRDDARILLSAIAHPGCTVTFQPETGGDWHATFNGWKLAISGGSAGTFTVTDIYALMQELTLCSTDGSARACA